MLRKLRSRLTYANVMSTIAVFVAVSTGGAYAANTVFSSDIVDGEVKSVDIANNSIHSGDILDNTINTFDVHSFLGDDVIDGTLTSADVQDDSLSGVDIIEQNLSFQNTLVSSDICDGCLLDQDIAEGTFVNFAATIGTVPVGCSYRDVTGINAQGDHLVLTPNFNDSNGSLQYAIQYRPDQEVATIQVCNRTTSAINDGTTHFNLLVIDA